MINYITSSYTYDKFKNIIKLIYESGGVAAAKYQELISYIIDLIMHLNIWNNLNFDIYVNDELKENNKQIIDIAQEIIIRFQFGKNNNTSAEYLPNETKVSLNNNEIQSVMIYVYVNIDTIKKQELLITLLIYHEFNHCIEDIAKIKKNLPSLKNIESITVDYQKVCKNITDNNMSFPYIIYRLFVDTEMNAMIALLYGELDVVKPNRDTITASVKNSEVFQIFKTLYKFYSKYVNVNDISYVRNIKQYFPKKKNLSDIKFKKWFITLYLQRMKVLWYKLWKASYYYLDQNESVDFDFYKHRFYKDMQLDYFNLNESLKTKYSNLYISKYCTFKLYNDNKIIGTYNAIYKPILNLIFDNNITAYLQNISEYKKLPSFI